MEARLQRWVQRHGWDRAVEHYERCWRTQLAPAHDAVLAAAGLEPGERVLDVACGTGMVTLPAARAVGATGTVLAIDLAERMVADVSARAAAEGLDHVVARRGDAEDLGPVGPFDVALCSLGLMYVPDPARAVRELARVLAPGGRVAAAVWGERRRCGWAGVFPIVDARVTSDVCPLFFALGARGALAGLFESAGFVDLVERRLTTELVYDGDDDAIGAAFLGGPVALAHARFDDVTRAEVQAEYLASIAPARHGTRYRVPGQFVVVSGRAAASPSTDHGSHVLLHHQPQGAMT